LEFSAQFFALRIPFGRYAAWFFHIGFWSLAAILRASVTHLFACFVGVEDDGT
jgi:hypothetical protein